MGAAVCSSHMSLLPPQGEDSSHSSSTLQHRVIPTGDSPPPTSPVWVLPMGCRGAAWLTRVCTRTCRGTSALVPGAPPPPPSSLTWVSAEMFLSHFPTPLPGWNSAGFFPPPFLNTISHKLYYCHWWSWPWPVTVLSWSQLALALSDMEEAPGSLSQKPPL